MRDRFPQEAVLRDGTRLLIRPFNSSDTAALYAFFQRLPEEVRRFAWDRIDSRPLVEQWGRELDYDRVLPLIATDGQRIVADATLHRREGSPLRPPPCALAAGFEADAVQPLTGLGFDRYLVPGYGTDPDGNQHDMVKMVLELWRPPALPPILER